MKIGFNLLLWTPAATEEHFAVMDSLKKWGYDGVEFPMFDTTASPWKELGKHAADLGLGITGCTIVSEEANPVSEDKSTMAFPFRDNCTNDVIPAKGDRSDVAILLNLKVCKATKADIPSRL